MFGFSLSTQIFQGSTQRTWNCVSNFVNLIWGKFNHIKQDAMPRSRKRHHSRSRSRSRSLSRDRSYDRHKKNDSNEKDGKRRRVDEVDSPLQKRSLSAESHKSTDNEIQRIQDVNEHEANINDEIKADISWNEDESIESVEVPDLVSNDMLRCNERDDNAKLSKKVITGSVNKDLSINDTVEITPVSDNSGGVSMLELKNEKSEDIIVEDVPYKIVNETKSNNEQRVEENVSVSDSEDVIVSSSDFSKLELKADKNEKFSTPQHPSTPKQLQKKLESEKKRIQRQKEKEERERQKQEEKAKILAEKQKTKQQKEAERQKLLDQKQKEKEMKEEQKRKEKEEKEQKRKEKEEQETQKRKEKELEKLKKQQEIEEKNKEKQKEEEKKQKTAALFVGFFKKTEAEEKERKAKKINCNFMPFEIKSDMRLPPLRRDLLSIEDINKLEFLIEKQEEHLSYLQELKSGVVKVGKSFKTWPYEDPEDEVTIIEEDKILGETICGDTSIVHKTKAKFLFFHENRRPAYFGTWRKKSKNIKPRRPFGEDTDIFNYEEDSDDDWEEEEQGESLDASNDEEDKDADNAEDDYEVDNEFFVPHGHLSDDEIDDEENARLSPESLKQKLKLLKDEFDVEIKSKTHKLKPRSIGCIWYSKKGGNVDAIQRYLQPFAMIVRGQIEIKKRSEIFVTSPEKKKLKTIQELPVEHIPCFLKIIHGNVNRKKVVIEQFLTYMANNGLNVEVSKANLTRFLKQTATYKRCKESGPMKNKFGWFVNDDINDKYNVKLELPSKTENSSC